MTSNDDALTAAEYAQIVQDAYNRRIRSLHSTLRAWAVLRGLTVTPADDGTCSFDLARGQRRVTVRLIPSWEQQGPGAETVVVESDDNTGGLRMVAHSGDSGMPTAAALKGLLTGLLFPEDLALDL
ncbi:hypothetical protein [Nocardia sp. NPDC051750]|uniref:hypothetical protein n=1 Tax=Nocardia sp. NPDC051750 TaxID=3364325 RepID=UPI0037BE0C03